MSLSGAAASSLIGNPARSRMLTTVSFRRALLPCVAPMAAALVNMVLPTPGDTLMVLPSSAALERWALMLAETTGALESAPVIGT